ncbi:hypothetical protein JX266_002981 [Neoarthrinium moseri]|nr:hypothetical protein JX266_002981 [Neoarthrinium moseri]
MRSSILVAAAAVSVSGSVLPRASFGGAPNLILPDSEFRTFEIVSLDEAKAGKDLEILGLPQSQNDTADKVQLTATATTAESEACSANPSIHVEWHRASSSQRQGFIDAVKCLLNKPASGNFPPATNRYEDLVRLHQEFMSDVHRNAKFLVWHRYYLWTFEQVLRDECGFAGPMVWWDETLDSGRFGQSEVFSPSYFGSLPAPAQNGNAVCVNDGAFAGLVLNIGPQESNRPHCLSRAGDEGLSAQINDDYVDLCNERTSFAEFANCLEFGTHGLGHNAIGGRNGVMADVWASPSDPTFWLHHSFVDHTWELWQSLDAAIRTQIIGGIDANGNPLTLDTVLTVGGIRPDVPVRAVVNTLSGVSIGGVPFCFKYDS